MTEVASIDGRQNIVEMDRVVLRNLAVRVAAADRPTGLRSASLETRELTGVRKPPFARTVVCPSPTRKNYRPYTGNGRPRNAHGLPVVPCRARLLEIGARPS